MKFTLTLLLVLATIALITAATIDAPCPVCSVDRIEGHDTCICALHKQLVTLQNGTEYSCCSDIEIDEKKWWKDLLGGVVSGFFG
jgi:hypothetical protein